MLPFPPSVPTGRTEHARSHAQRLLHTKETCSVTVTMQFIWCVMHRSSASGFVIRPASVCMHAGAWM